MAPTTWQSSAKRKLPCPPPTCTDLAVERHEVELEDRDLEDLEEDDGVPAQQLDGPHKVKAVVLELQGQHHGKDRRVILTSASS